MAYGIDILCPAHTLICWRDARHELRSVPARHTVHIRGRLLGYITMVTLLRVTGELVQTATLDTGYFIARLKEVDTTATLGHEAGLLSSG